MTLDSDDEETPPCNSASNLPQLKQSSSMYNNQCNKEGLTDTEGALSPSVSIISISSSESQSPKQKSLSDKNKTRTPTSASKNAARNPCQQSPVSSVCSNASNQTENVMNSSPIINTPPASINSESYNSRMAKDMSSPKRAPNPNLEPKQTSSLSSVESIINTARNASDYIQHQNKNPSNRPNQVANSNQRPSSSNRHHNLVGSNNKIQKQTTSRPDYLNKEKAHLINEQVRSVRSPNMNETDPNCIFRYKEAIPNNYLSNQLSRPESESNRKHMDNRGPFQGQPFFLNNKPVNSNIDMNNINLNRTNTNKINHSNMNYNSGQRLANHPFQIPPGHNPHQYRSNPYS